MSDKKKYLTVIQYSIGYAMLDSLDNGDSIGPKHMLDKKRYFTKLFRSGKK